MFYENAFPSKSHESAKFWFEKTPSPVSSDTIAAQNPSKKRQEASRKAPCHLLNRKREFNTP